MVKEMKGQSGIFPGRFQPFTNAHLKRIEKIIQDYPGICLTIVVGDVGALNLENFLTPKERVEMIEKTMRSRGLVNIHITVVRGDVPDVWVDRLRSAVKSFEIVFSDNPFVTEPLRYAGYKVVRYRREGEDSTNLRKKPFTLWRGKVPPEVYAYIHEHKLYNRLLELPSTGRYPFLPKNTGKGDDLK